MFESRKWVQTVFTAARTFVIIVIQLCQASITINPLHSLAPLLLPQHLALFCQAFLVTSAVQ